MYVCMYVCMYFAGFFAYNIQGIINPNGYGAEHTAVQVIVPQ